MLDIVAHARTPHFLKHLLRLEQQRTLGFKPRRAVIDALLAKIPAKAIDPAELDALGAAYANYVTW